jgi:predicted permease
MVNGWQGDWTADIRYGARMLAKSPGFTAVAVLTLALGIAVNAVVFSYVNALLLRPAQGVAETSRLAEVWLQNKKAAGVERFFPLTYPDYVYYQDHNGVFSGMVAFDGDPEAVVWNRAGNGELVQGQIVSGNFFAVMGVRAALGRALLPEDDQASAIPTVMLSYAFWRGRFGGDASALGQVLMLNGTEYRVVGVAPAGFAGLEIGIEPDFWAPLAMAEHITHDAGRLTNRNAYWLSGVGRLKEGVGISEARAEMSVLALQIAKEHPDTNKDLDATVYPETLVPGPYRGYVAAFTGLLMAVTGLVLLIACVNSANLLLMRAVGRRREMAIRSALGASRGRLIRQILVESTLLAGMAGCAGLLLALWTAPLLMRLKPEGLPIKLEAPLDWRVIAFTLGASLVTGIVFGLAPALRATRTELVPALQSDSRGGGYRKSRLRTGLVVAQVATCVVLLVGAVLCVRSLMNAESIDPGFDTRHEAVATLEPGRIGYSEAQGRAFYERLLEVVENLPGVTAASWVSHLPLGSAREMTGVAAEGAGQTAGKENASADVLRVGPRYFEAMGIPMSRGRDFTAEESKVAMGVVIVNEAMARQLWPRGDALGQHVRFGEKSEAEVIGVVRTGKYRTLGEDARPLIYRPIGYTPEATLVVRSMSDPRSLLDPIRQEIEAVDPNLAATDLETMQQHMTLPLFPARAIGILLGVFGGLAMVLAVGGLYGVISYTTSQRTREIGIRVALGAQHKDVARMVLKHGVSMAAWGIAIGAVAGYGVTRVLSTLLYGVRADDPLTFIGVAIALIGVTLLACYAPARRAMGVDPTVALRYE